MTTSGNRDKYVADANGVEIYVHNLADGSTALIVGEQLHTLDSVASRRLAGLLDPARSSNQEDHIETTCLVSTPFPVPVHGHTTEPHLPSTKLKQTKSNSKRLPENVSALVEAGLLAAGDILLVTRRDEEFYGEVTQDGLLEVEGERFASPAPAAAKALKTKAAPGWSDWHTADGRTLGDLRWELRLGRFPPESGAMSDRAVNDRRRVARQWVEYALATKGANPAKPDPAAVNGFLAQFADSTADQYRGWLNQWFEGMPTPRRRR